ncbi:unnamed protein product [Spirodela intermedia]|uniref:Purple acid phosphatase n=1 Tax=Spirodela intermedia TaxID=51605 RepID=A0A7I8J218_SPIIN|nr:unnamed protein product [Spirodela intermedia]CAA6664265.1 unnamed protein product [Spirodela intermedia]
MAAGGGGFSRWRGGGSPPVLLLALTAVGLQLLLASAELQRVAHPAKNDGSLSVLVVGDWGRRGGYNQSKVAAQMGRVGEKLDIDFIISTGDNFYDTGIRSVEDRAFEESFTDIYTASSLQKPWYAVLGNHDYHGDVLAQLSPALREIDRRWICMRSFIVDAEVAEFFFVDTVPFVLRYWKHPGLRRYDWRGDLEAALRASPARWKIVVGHNPIRSASVHGNTKELDELLLPVLKANDVDLYINGHDHCLEHISSNDRGVFKPNADRLMFFYDGQGFLSIQLTRDRLKLAFHDVAGEVLHRWSTAKALHPFI